MTRTLTVADAELLLDQLIPVAWNLIDDALVPLDNAYEQFTQIANASERIAVCLEKLTQHIGEQ